tara:strand:+ start:4342 stop:6042 length:1701 start_codon:yes stop_codon:yes gene_type:complete
MTTIRNIFYSLTIAITACNASAAERPDFGLILNDDGDLSFASPDPSASEAFLRANIRGLSGSSIGTLVTSIGSGSDTLNYPTQVASPLGWRKTKHENGESFWGPRIENARAGIAAGFDPIRTAGSEAKSLGMYFLPSLRMNDSHFIFDPFNYPLTGEFWLENYDRLLIDDSPVDFRQGYENLFDFSEPEVRAYRLGVIAEAIDRYEDIIDGFELDFNRVQIFFPRNKAEENAHLMTDLVLSVRTMLNEASERQGRPMYLFVRIPPSLADSDWAGLDVRTWIREGLVDLVSPAQLMTLAQDMPIQDLIDIAKENEVLVYPSLYPRTAWRWPLDPQAPGIGPLKMARRATPEELMGAASAYYAMGANGFYLYNFYGVEQAIRPYPDWFYAFTRAISEPQALEGAPLIYFVTQTYYYDDADPSYAYKKQIPIDLENESTEITLRIGKTPNSGLFPIQNCFLRIGASGSGSAKAPAQILINGNEVDVATGSIRERSVSEMEAKRTRGAADHYWFYPLDDPSILREGENSIEISWPGNVRLTDLELGVSYHNNITKHWKREPSPINEVFQQ